MVNQRYDPHRPVSARGADRDRHVREAGCDGRGWYRRRAIPVACGEGVWSWHPWAGAKSPDDDLEATVTIRSRTPGRARYKSQRHRAGKAGCFGLVTNSCAFLTAHEAAGAASARSSLRPLLFEGEVRNSSGAIAPREGSVMPSSVMPCACGASTSELLFDRLIVAEIAMLVIASVAKQSRMSPWNGSDCFVAIAPRNDGTDHAGAPDFTSL
jgi:hypothetical protein